MISAQCIVIPNEGEGPHIEAWIALDNGRVLMSLWEVLRIRSG